MAAIMVIITAACPVVQAVLLYAAGGIKCIIMHDRGSRGFWLPFCNHFVVDIVDQLVLYCSLQCKPKEVYGMEPIRIKNSEWNVLNCLWEKNPQTVMQLVARLGESVGWAKSTTITTLRRMEEKGLVHCEIIGKGKSYTPAVEQENAVISETRSFLDRVYQGSVGLMMSAMAKRQELTAEDLAELRKILEEAEGKESESC